MNFKEFGGWFECIILMRHSYKPSALAIELNSSKAIAVKELSLSSWCIASLYIYHLSFLNCG